MVRQKRRRFEKIRRDGEVGCVGDGRVLGADVGDIVRELDNK